MRHSELLNQVRESVQQALNLSGSPDEDISETILVRDGHYCGRRFQSEHGHAVWFLEENQIKVYSSDGQVLILHPGAVPAQSIAPASQTKAA